MCGRYYRTADKQAIADALYADATGDPLAYAPGFNIAPTTTQPVLRQARDTYQRELVPMRWGLIGFGSAAIDPKRSTFNARAEGLEASSLWRRPLHKQRCIVPISGFYEWRKSDKHAYRFYLEGTSVMGLAGLWDAWKQPDGAWLQSFSIVTTFPNGMLAAIHDRMPVILDPKDYDEWLDRDEVERAPVHLLRPYSGPMCLRDAHPKVGNVRNQGPEMLNSL